LLASTIIYGQKLEVDGKAKVTEMDTIIGATANVVRQSDGTLALRQYKVGDFDQGGIVFWVDGTGEHGLVADTADITDFSNQIEWSNGINYKVTNASGDGVGSGEMNTMLIIAQQTADNTAGTFAALQCTNLIRGSYGDWYLPSKEELNLMYINLHSSGIGSFQDLDYWSSTEFSGTDAWMQDFINGALRHEVKGNKCSVRAIRTF
jgi:hypothetical protein